MTITLFFNDSDRGLNGSESKEHKIAIGMFIKTCKFDWTCLRSNIMINIIVETE